MKAKEAAPRHSPARLTDHHGDQNICSSTGPTSPTMTRPKEKVSPQLKRRKLSAVRIHRSGIFGVPVGHKARLLGRSAALRVAKRLRRAGLEVTCDAMQVVTTSEQREFLDWRAANTARRRHTKSSADYKGAV